MTAPRYAALRTFAGALGAMVLFGMCTFTGASAAPPRGTVTFQLQVHGVSAPGTTYWVAYGPLAGRFGVIRLQARGHGLFSAQRRLPLRERTSIAFVAGQGCVFTPAGQEPGGRVVTISARGPGPLQELAAQPVSWQAPAG